MAFRTRSRPATHSSACSGSWVCTRFSASFSSFSSFTNSSAVWRLRQIPPAEWPLEGGEEMDIVWFIIVAIMVVAYSVLDGLDLGAGAIHWFVARTPDERQVVLRAIGPIWDGNEVWLLAAGGTLYFAFPAVYASSFSGFYLPLMLVLWLLMLRGIS